MRGLTMLSLAFLLPAIAGCTPTPAEQARIDQRQPTQCIGQYQTRQVTAYGPTIVYTLSPRLKYVSETQGGCETIGQRGRNDILVTRTTTGQLCAGDIAQTVDRVSGFFTGSCSFGPFVPYRAGK